MTGAVQNANSARSTRAADDESTVWFAMAAGPADSFTEPRLDAGIVGRRIMILTYILIAVAVVVVGFVIVVAMQPADFRIERSATVAAPPHAVFEQVNDLHRWTAWSPWEKLDPAMKRTYEGAPAGAGASYSWSGNKQVGEGRMTITDSRQ